MKKLKQIIDYQWVKDNPEDACDLIHALLDKEHRDVNTMKVLDRALEIERGRNMLLQSMIEIDE